MPSRSDIEAGRAFVRLYVRNSEFTRGLTQARRTLNEFAISMEAVGRRIMAIGFTASIPLALATNQYAKWDDQMREVQAVSGTTAAEMLKLREASKSMAKELGFSAVHVGELMAELGRMDYTAAEIDKATQAILALARASNTDAALAAKIVGESLKMFGWGAERAGQMADYLTVTANKSITTVESLGDSLRYVGPVAAGFGLTVKETLALVGGLSNIGLSGELAGTSLRRLLTLTTSAPDKMKAAFGVDYVGPGGSLRKLVDYLDLVHKKMAGLSTTQRAKRIHEAYGILGITGASGIGATAVEIRELEKQIGDSRGEAERQAELMNAGVGGAFRRIRAAVEVAGIELGEVFAAQVYRATNACIRLINTIVNFAKANKELTINVAKWALGLFVLGGALVGLGLVLGIIRYGISTFMSILAMAGLVLGSTIAPIGKIARGAQLASMAVTGAMQQIANAFLGARKTITKELVYLFRGPVPQFSGVLHATAAGAVSAFRNVAAGVRTAFSTLRGVPTIPMNAFQAGIKSIAFGVRQLFVGLGGNLAGGLAGIPKIMNQLGHSIRNLGAVVIANARPLIDFFTMFSPLLGKTAMAWGYLAHVGVRLPAFFQGLKGNLILNPFDKLTQDLNIAGLKLRHNLTLLWQLASSGFRAGYVVFRYMVIRDYRRVRDAILNGISAIVHAISTSRISFAIKIFTTALRGLPITVLSSLGRFGPAIWAAMTPIQRGIWLAGANIRYRLVQLTGYLTAFKSFMNRYVVSGAKVFGNALIGRTYSKSAMSWMTPLQYEIYKVGRVFYISFVRPAVLGLKAIAAVGVASFKVIQYSVKLTAAITMFAFKAIAPVIGRALMATLSGIKSITVSTVNYMLGQMYRLGRAGVRGIRQGVGGIFGLGMNVMTMAAMGGGALAGNLAGWATGIALIVPSILGLLNPMTALTVALAGGAYYWFRYTDAGKAAFSELRGAILPIIDIIKTTVGGIAIALEAGDLQLAGKIMAVGLKAGFVSAMGSLSDVIGGVFGDAIARITSRILSGDFKGAWEISTKTLAALWAELCKYMMATFIKVADVIREIWNKVTMGIARDLFRIDSSGSGMLLEFIETMAGTPSDELAGLNTAEQSRRLAELDDKRLASLRKLRDEYKAQAEAFKAAGDTANYNKYIKAYEHFDRAVKNFKYTTAEAAAFGSGAAAPGIGTPDLGLPEFKIPELAELERRAAEARAALASSDDGKLGLLGDKEAILAELDTLILEAKKKLEGIKEAKALQEWIDEEQAAIEGMPEMPSIASDIAKSKPIVTFSGIEASLGGARGIDQDGERHRNTIDMLRMIKDSVKATNKEAAEMRAIVRLLKSVADQIAISLVVHT